MGACAILPRIIGQSRASELLYTGRFMAAEEGERWGFFSRIVAPEQVLSQAQHLAREIAEGPTFANDQANAGDGMGDVGGGGDRSRSYRAGPVHDDGGFYSRIRGVFEQGEAGISRELRATNLGRTLQGNCFRFKIIRMVPLRRRLL
jgi:enoyl-CoA hydratase/carnithine racemase